MNNKELIGKYVKLVPLEISHAEALVEASSSNPELFKWTFVPRDIEAMNKYIEVALKGKESGSVEAFVIIDLIDGQIKGSTRYWNIERWQWPKQHQYFQKKTPDVCEIGHTWLTESALRTPVNTECKLLLLGNAFENWNVLRVCFQTDVRNLRSRAAIERIGGKFEGIVRAERLAADNTIRDTARFSIILSEWPAVKEKLITRLYS